MSLKPQFVNIQFADETIQLKQLTRSQLAHADKIESMTDKANYLLCLSVYQHGIQLFPTPQEADEISFSASEFLLEQIALANSIGVKKN